MIIECDSMLGNWCLRNDLPCNLECYKRMMKYLNELEEKEPIGK
jgi:hypothetical protein